MSADPEDVQHELALGQAVLARGFMDRDQLIALEAEQAAAPHLMLQAQLLVSHGYLNGIELAHLLRGLRDGSAMLAESLEVLQARRAAAPPECVGKYRVIEEIARGGAASVYRAVDTELDRPVALKILWEEPGQERLLFRLHREAELSAGLLHPHIISVHEVGLFTPDDGRAPLHYIAMDYVEGGSLADRLPGLSRSERLELLAQVAEGVGYAHSQGVVHRDLKPGNILLSETSRAIVTDFGLARDLHDADEFTRTWTVMGTMHYMAPEQVSGHSKECDARTDVWALGVMLYLLLSDKYPFPGSSSWEVYSGILEHQPVPLQDSNAWAICCNALQKARDLRYADGQAFLHDLRNLQAGRPVGARAPRRLRTAALLLPLLAALIGGLLFALRKGSLPAGSAADSVQGPELALQPLPADQRQWRGQMAGVARQTEQFRASLYIAGQDIPTKRRRLSAALRKLALLTTQHPTEAALWISLGIGWYWVGEEQRAEQALQRAELLAPKDGWVSLYLGRIQLYRAMALQVVQRAGHSDHHLAARGKRAIQLAVSYMTRDVVGWDAARPIDRALVAAYLLVSQSNRAGLNRLCKGVPEHFEGQLGIEEFWILCSFFDRPAMREAALSRAIERRPHYAMAYFLRACARSEQRNYSPAIEDCMTALTLRPRLIMARFSLGTLRQLVGDLAGAAEEYTRVLDQDPLFLSALQNRASMRYKLGQLQAGLADCNRFLAIQPKSPEMYQNRSRIYQGLGRLELALADAERALALDRTQAKHWFWRAVVRKRKGDLQGALADYTEALRLDPKYAVASNNRGSVHRLLGRPKLAMADYDRALELDPKLVHARLNRANMRGLTSDLRGAMADLSEVIQIDPKFAPAWVKRGRLLHHLRRYAESIRDLEQAVKLDPGKARPYYYLGNSQENNGDSAAAILCYTRAVELDQQLEQAYFRRAVVLVAQNENLRALKDLRLLTLRFPANWRSWAVYGQVLCQLRNRREGVIALREARRLAPRKEWPQLDRELASNGG